MLSRRNLSCPSRRSSPNSRPTLTTFKINSCKSVSKQRTLTPFRMNTYEKNRGSAPPPPVYNQQLPRLQLRERPSYAPRGASIPCGLTRLRILPVTTWVGRILPRSATFLRSNVQRAKHATIASSSFLPTGGTYLCPQTAHVAVHAFPNRLLSLSLEATSKDVSFPSRPRPCCSAATAPESSPHTSCPPSRKSSSAARSPRKRLRPGWWVRSGPTETPTSTVLCSWPGRSIFGESISKTCLKPKGKPPKRCWSAAVVTRGRWPTTAISRPT